MGKDKYMCQLCQNHGIYDVPKKGHKQLCPFRNCLCEACSLNVKRRKLDQAERQLKKGPDGFETSEFSPANGGECSRQPVSASFEVRGQPPAALSCSSPSTIVDHTQRTLATPSNISQPSADYVYTSGTGAEFYAARFAAHHNTSVPESGRSTNLRMLYPAGMVHPNPILPHHLSHRMPMYCPARYTPYPTPMTLAYESLCHHRVPPGILRQAMQPPSLTPKPSWEHLERAVIPGQNGQNTGQNGQITGQNGRSTGQNGRSPGQNGRTPQKDSAENRIQDESKMQQRFMNMKNGSTESLSEQPSNGGPPKNYNDTNLSIFRSAELLAKPD